jgi:hypothetical protein
MDGGRRWSLCVRSLAEPVISLQCANCQETIETLNDKVMSLMKREWVGLTDEEVIYLKCWARLRVCQHDRLASFCPRHRSQTKGEEHMTQTEALRLALSTLNEVREETFRLLRNGERLYAETKRMGHHL